MQISYPHNPKPGQKTQSLEIPDSAVLFLYGSGRVFPELLHALRGAGWSTFDAANIRRATECKPRIFVNCPTSEAELTDLTSLVASFSHLAIRTHGPMSSQFKIFRPRLRLYTEDRPLDALAAIGKQVDDIHNAYFRRAKAA